MDILRINEHIRDFFKSSGGNELPCFPEAIQCPSFHPDFFLASVGKAKHHSLFAFQMLNDDTTSVFSDSISAPGLIWQFSYADSSDLLKNVIELLTKMSECLEADGLIVNFSIAPADGTFCNICSRGTAWEILLNGVKVGQVRIISELAGSCMLKDIVSLHLNTTLLLDYAKEAASGEELRSPEVSWNSNSYLGQILALKAYNVNHSDSEVLCSSIDTIIKESEEMGPRGFDEVNAFIRILTFLNHFSENYDQQLKERAFKWLINSAERLSNSLYCSIPEANEAKS